MQFEVFVSGSPERVWQAIVDGKESAQYFFGTAFSSSLKPGAAFTYAFPDGNVAVDGKVIEVEPAKRLVTTWKIRYDPSCAAEESRVTWTLEPRGATTKLVLAHDVDEAPATAKNVGNDGWSLVLSGLKTLVETGKPLAIA